jgi:hypothetical protein
MASGKTDQQGENNVPTGTLTLTKITYDEAVELIERLWGVSESMWEPEGGVTVVYPSGRPGVKAAFRCGG